MRKPKANKINLQTKVPINARVSDIISSVVSFELPIYIPIPDGEYETKINRKKFKIRLQRINHSKEYVSKGFLNAILSNGASSISADDFIMEMGYDRWGRFLKTNIEVEVEGYIDHHSEIILKKSILDMPKDKLIHSSLIAVNRLIEVYRNISLDPQIERLSYPDIVFSKIYYRKKDGTLQYEADNFVICRDCAKMSFNGKLGFKGEPYVEAIKQALLKETTYSNDIVFMLNSKDALLREDFRRAILEAVISLEIVVSNFISHEYKKKNLNPESDDLKNFLTDTGIRHKITSIIPLFLHDDTIDDKTVSECKGAIKIRNKIVHEGRVGINEVEATEAVFAIEEYVKRLKEIMSK